MVQMVAFGDIVKENNRLTEVLDEKEYACGGVRLHGRGVFIREYKFGSEIKKKFVQHILKEGDVVYSTLFAKAGAFAVADEKTSGAILSEKFPTFVFQNKLVSPEYLKWLFRSGQLNRIAEDQTTGMAAFSLAHLSKKKFLQLKIPAPSPDRQAEVVRLCEEATAETSRCLVPIQNNVLMLDGLIGAAAAKMFANLPKAKLADIGDYVLRHIEIKAGTNYSQITVAMKHRGLRLRRICDGSEIKSSGQTFVTEGDILFSRIDIRQGAIGFVSKDLEGGVVTRDFPVFRLKSVNESDMSFLKYVFMSPEFMAQAKDASRGTTGRKKMKRPAFLEFTIPWPSNIERALIAEKLEQVSRQANALLRNYKHQELLAKGVSNSVVQTLFAQDAGLV